jgi:hypothetical protein
MDYNFIKDKLVALLIWNADQENDVHVYVGRIILENTKLLFSNESKGWRVNLDEEQFDRLKEVPPDMKDTFLDADYFISLSMTNLPNENNEGFSPTGMNWK